MRFALFILVPALMLSGCATVKLTDQERAVRIFRKSDPPAACKELKKVYASKMFMAPDAQDDWLRKKTFEAGGNAVLISGEDSEFLNGVAFSCP